MEKKTKRERGVEEKEKMVANGTKVESEEQKTEGDDYEGEE